MTISDEAVEAARRAMEDVPSYCHNDPDEIRKVLDAAAPHIAAEAWNLGLSAGIKCERGQVIANPYEVSK